MNYFLCKEIDDEVVNELVAVFNIMQEEEHLDLFVSCTGGIMPYGDVIEILLNKYPEKTTMYVVGDCSSTALDIFFRFKGKRVVRDYACGVLHLSDAPLSSRGLRSKSSVQHKAAKMYDSIDENSIKEWESHLTKSEISSLRRGEDVFFDTHRLRKIIKSQAITITDGL